MFSRNYLTLENTLHPLRLQNLAREWLLEDCTSFDFASAGIRKEEGKATIYIKSDGMLAGIPFAEAVFKELDLRVKWCFAYKEGLLFESRGVVPVASVTGSTESLLLAERVALNVLSRASGVATAASSLCRRMRSLNWHGSIAGTRKTTPGFRMVEKYALAVGGADMHRHDLSSMVMLKDNHICLAGSITRAVERARKVAGFSLKIEVECSNLEQALEACKAKCDIVMFDNLSPKEFVDAAKALKTQFPNVLIEASGGISEKNAEEYVSPYTDIISCSSLVQGYRTVDFSMKIDPPKPISADSFIP